MWTHLLQPPKSANATNSVKRKQRNWPKPLINNSLTTSFLGHLMERVMLALWWLTNVNNLNHYWPPHHHTTTVLRPFFRDNPGETVPKENFRSLWCKGRLTEADTPTTRLGATPSGLISAHLHHPAIFFRPDALPATQPTASKHWRQTTQPLLSVTLLTVLTFLLTTNADTTTGETNKRQIIKNKYKALWAKTFARICHL